MRVFFDIIGCRLNQSEVEKMAGQFRAAGHEVVSSPAEADMVVVNTCAVTSEAASDSRQKIRQAARAGVEKIVVTGCWSTLDPQGAAVLPNVAQVVANAEKDHLVSTVLNQPAEVFELEPLARQPLPGLRARTRAFIKVQDGCDNHCTFCVTRLARGQSQSQPVETVLADIQAALLGGAQEIVLTGVHLGSWGQDLLPARSLRELLKIILEKCRIPRLRLSSLEPWDLEDDFFELWRDPRLCPHLHLPLQSGSAGVLRRMGRNTTPELFAALVAAARTVVPGMAITTDMITGFPGETETEFEESLAFVQQIGFAAGHVFHYSPRPGTPALRFPNQVDPRLSKQRSARLRAAFAVMSDSFRQQFVGQTAQVLWEALRSNGPEGWRLEGLTGNYIRVEAFAPRLMQNEFSQVLLTGLTDGGLAGTILSPTEPETVN
jgi:threonylcarbamoyladenosine tRNA methylthiotransferase MtaB